MSSYLSVVIIGFLLSNALAIIKDDVGDLSTTESSVVSFSEISLFKPIIADRRLYGISLSHNEVRSGEQLLDEGAYNFLDVAFSYPALSWSKNNTFIEISNYGGVYSQFKLSQGLVEDRVFFNSDFVIGNRLSLKFNNEYVVHLELDHRSSHLGDEYIIERVNQRMVTPRRDFNEDTLSLLFVGGSNLQWHFKYYNNIVARIINDQGSITNLAKNGISYGLSYRSSSFANSRLSPFISHSHKLEEKSNWKLAATTRVGILRESMQTNRKIMLAFEHFHGPSFFGEFYATDITIYGINLNIVY